MEQKDKIVLIGMPGCGKTTLGKVIASELNYNFCDMDVYIEKISNKSISELFEEGEDIFRQWETKACLELESKKRVVISSGGGVIKQKRNIDILSSSSIIVYINRSVSDISGDVDVESRPLLKNGKEKLYDLYKEREGLYKLYCDIEIKNEGYIKDVVKVIIRKLKDIIKE